MGSSGNLFSYEANRSCLTSSLKGVCYNKLQCLARGGQISGYCSNALLSEKSLYFTNPKYPDYDSEANSCYLTVYFQPNVCWIKIEYNNFQLPSSKNGLCHYNYLTIINGGSGSGSMICGFKSRMASLIERPYKTKENAIKINILTQAEKYAWNIRVVQIECDQIQPLPRDPSCGFTGAPNSLVARSLNTLESPRNQLRHIYKPHGGDGALNLNRISPLLRRKLNTEMNYPGFNIRGSFCKSIFHDEFTEASEKIINGVEAPWVMTAAHCFDFPNLHEFLEGVEVSIGDHDISLSNETRSTIRTIERIWIYPAWYRNPGSDGDLALIKLESPVVNIGSKAIHSVCMPDEHSVSKLESMKSGIAAGWGITESGDKSKSAENELNRIPLSVCKKNMEPLLIDIKKGMLCTLKGTNSRETVCSGDSGSPFMARYGSRFFVIGVVSFSTTDCNAPFPAVYTRVSQFVKWMGAVISSADS
ncbi:CTRL [Lepeophtheirus salmonis]|uniref:CTRL n=1 Tax=Lepeophtheirus salmonis TaxID=72036 RepID=A0A7R8H1K9_LEPSM|nr:CTRL [Lepeophtheirus salmonis]CAF2796093.1 CTRL [Lepeophtheirus salmonis]